MIAFGADRAGGQGQADIFIAHRASACDAFDTPVPLTAVNTPA